MIVRQLAVAAAAAALILAPQPSGTADAQAYAGPAAASGGQPLALGLSKSMVIDLPADAADVVLADPTIADAIMRTPRRVFLMGKAVGQTNAFFFDRAGRQIAAYDITVARDTASLQGMIDRFIPGGRIKAEAFNDSVVLTGTAMSLSEADQARAIAARFVEDEDDILSLLNIAAKDQVLLRVRIVEMQRSLVKQLGVDLRGTAILDDVFGGDVVGSFTTSNAFPIQSRFLAGFDGDFNWTNNGGGDLRNVGSVLRALERVGIVRTLAEPNLTAISGESAQFLAGGEFPVPVAQEDNEITVEFKPFGVGLGFTPVVLSEGRISLRVSTEVSELSSQGAFQGSSTVGVDPETGQLTNFQGITIPALTVRRAETTVELPSGRSLMIAGLIQEKTKQNLDQVPGLKSLPVLGSLFRSRDFQNDESEMVVIITPILVDPTNPDGMRTPADGYVNADDLESVFLGRVNEIYRVGGSDGKFDWKGPLGFVLD